MGTSKGYIAPTSIHWKKAKIGLTGFLSNPTEDKLKRAISRYAKAVKTDSVSLDSAASSVSGLLAFISSIGGGLREALREIGREDLCDLDPKEALDELLAFYANGGSTIDDALILDCLADAFENLAIDELTKISQADMNDLIREFACQFAKRKFAQIFDKHVREKSISIAEADKRLLDAQEYIYYTLKDSITDELLDSINPKKLNDVALIRTVIDKAFGMMEQWYGE